jgi:hypothetical protein
MLALSEFETGPRVRPTADAPAERGRHVDPFCVTSPVAGVVMLRRGDAALAAGRGEPTRDPNKEGVLV